MGYVSLTHSTVTRQIFGRGVVSMVTSVLFLGFLLLTLIGVPIAIALGCASLFVVLLLPHLNIELLVQGLVSGLDSFPLLAVLLFTLMGNVMSKCGISDKLLRLAEVFLANMKGGLGIVAVISCLIFGSISGTGSSTVAAIGMSMIPKMIESGYKPSFSGSLIASAGGLGVIIPPSVIMIIYAVSAQVSIIKLFSAGIIPGLLIALFLMIYCVYTARKEGIEGSHKVYTAQDKMEAIKGAILPLGLPVSILGGIYSGWFTPAESAAMGVLYCLILSGVVYRTLTFKKLCDLLVESCLLVSTVLIILAASVCFGRIMAIEEVPTQIADFILSVSETPWVILLGINLLLLIVGTFMETLAAIVILTPILLPIVLQLGVDPVHFGIIMIVNLSIGFVTPPLGANLFMTVQVGNIPFSTLARSIWPCVGIMVLALLLISFIPAISLWLPVVLYGAS